MLDIHVLFVATVIVDLLNMITSSFPYHPDVFLYSPLSLMAHSAGVSITRGWKSTNHTIFVQYTTSWPRHLLIKSSLQQVAWRLKSQVSSAEVTPKTPILFPSGKIFGLSPWSDNNPGYLSLIAFIKDENHTLDKHLNNTQALDVGSLYEVHLPQCSCEMSILCTSRKVVMIYMIIDHALIHQSDGLLTQPPSGRHPCEPCGVGANLKRQKSVVHIPRLRIEMLH